MFRLLEKIFMPGMSSTANDVRVMQMYRQFTLEHLGNWMATFGKRSVRHKNLKDMQADIVQAEKVLQVMYEKIEELKGWRKNF